MVQIQTARSGRAELSRVPYLPGLDGLRALAVVAVMVYHANHAWLSGGFLGVEVFFVISGYLITLLLVGEYERDRRVDLRSFWFRRFRRLLPAVFVMLSGLAVYMAIFHPRPQGQTRGDFLAGIFYGSNWYQILVGQGYTAGEAFAPLRHLWSLAVEEQFYLLWPLVMMLILARASTRLPRVALWLFGVSVTIALAVGVLYASGDIAVKCSSEAMHGYWIIFGRCVNINEALYLGTFSRAGGLMMGAAFAMVWRPVAILRGPLRDKGRQLDLLAGGGLAVIALLMWKLTLSEQGTEFGIRFDPWLFRGGFFLTGIATVLIIAAATHQLAATGTLLGNPLLRWIGTRSYGLYLYHWPIYQIIREFAGVPLSVGQFVLAMAIALPITEASYRFIETPIRKGRLREVLSEANSTNPTSRVQRRNLTVIIVSVAGLTATAVYSFAVADNLCVGDVACSIAAGHATDTTAPPATVAVTASPTLPGATTPDAASTSTSTTIDVATLPPLAIGESVMLGAKADLEAGGLHVDAEESRSGTQAAELLEQYRAAGTIGRTVVIQSGTNGSVSSETYDRMMAALPQADTPTVVFLTIKAPTDWATKNNERIRALPARYPWVTIADWETASAGTKLCKDGIHIACNGVEPAMFYSNLIFDAIGRPELKYELTPPST